MYFINKVSLKQSAFVFSNTIDLLSLLFLGTAAADDQFPDEGNKESNDETEKGDDIEEEVLIPGQPHCRALHPSIVRVSEQVFQPPNRPGSTL